MEAAVELAVAELIADATGNGIDKATLVAGQALALWGRHYSIEIEEQSENPLASKDVDFFEQKTTKVEDHIESIRNKLSERGYSIKDVHWAKKSDSTPEVAKLILVSSDAGEIIVDFLGHIGGLNSKAIARKSRTVALEEGINLRVLHPIECLKARIHNLTTLYPSIYSGSSNGKIEVETIRVKIALEIVNRYFIEELSNNTSKEVNREQRTR